MLRGTDAQLLPKRVPISVQERREHFIEDSIGLGTIFGDPRPHRGEGVGKSSVAAAACELAC